MIYGLAAPHIAFGTYYKAVGLLLHESYGIGSFSQHDSLAPPRYLLSPLSPGYVKLLVCCYYQRSHRLYCAVRKESRSDAAVRTSSTHRSLPTQTSSPCCNPIFLKSLFELRPRNHLPFQSLPLMDHPISNVITIVVVSPVADHGFAKSYVDTSSIAFAAFSFGY